MSRLAVIHQPDFLPYLGFFERLLHCDVYVVLDHVQYIKGGWQNRDKIKTPEGVKWLTVPLKLKGKTFSPYNKVEISDNPDWKSKHLKTLERCYGDAKFFGEIFPSLEKIYNKDFCLMVDFNFALLRELMCMFQLDTELVFSSGLDPQGTANHMLVDLLKKVGATRYLSGVGARDYFEECPYVKEVIEVEWQDFCHPVYPQLHGDFVPYLSSIDLLFNCGMEESRAILRRK